MDRYLSTSSPTQNLADPVVAPLSLGNLRAVGAGAARELRWGLLGVRSEMRHWRALAAQIPDPVLRADALGSLADKRYYVDGAALFWILPSRRVDELLGLLVAFQTISNYLDYASERGADHRGASAGSLMLALVDAVDIDEPLHDYYADHPWTDDGGYLRALVLRCRRACITLPRYEEARPLLNREARRGYALELCHDPNPLRRDEGLQKFAAREFGAVADAAWFELACAPTSLLSVIVLLALAADEASTDDDLRAALDVYNPWVGALSLALDSYIDQADDAETGDWSAIAYHPNSQVAQQRIATLIDRALREAATLRHGQRHVVIIAAMIAMYLTSDSATSGPIAASTRRLRQTGGTLTAMLIPLLRCWRILYRQRR
jgi:tetraprenyl-beta-curcumene synthase